MYITRDETIMLLHDLMNLNVLDSDLCDELNDIASCIAHKDLGLDTLHQFFVILNHTLKLIRICILTHFNKIK